MELIIRAILLETRIAMFMSLIETAIIPQDLYNDDKL